jgi:hypothetical protein
MESMVEEYTTLTQAIAQGHLHGAIGPDTYQPQVQMLTEMTGTPLFFQGGPSFMCEHMPWTVCLQPRWERMTVRVCIDATLAPHMLV